MSTVFTAPLPEHDDYWEAARRPLAATCFVLPLILAYEIGLLTCPSAGMALRNGADCWMRAFLAAGMGIQAALLPAVVVASLLAWQVAARHPWRCRVETLIGMFGESLILATALFVLARLIGQAFATMVVAQIPAASDPVTVGGRAISFVGAGIYEEVLFRLLLLPGVVLALRGLLLPRGLAILLGVLLSSVVFSAAHYIEVAPGSGTIELWGPLQHVLETRELWFGFLFRAAAGVWFAILFYLRGFGITVGCHVLYDIMVGIVVQPAAH
ncbi:CAAX amino terminal protease self- immunity [Maioricimonas rarisocia]|uniref:CAAX amino terminal protease self-immunity n=1 Tax=Maioricimonas rarisocia TaxID=2528026 RepID=A0A517Z5M3_9PLAN|nr:CPBP family glutamic-type intramembrane protease [Maioricimonas rarisocia]QDU37776.1 CAAX amino terminal protease self- immunity [Maioricimonas rarisocia]